VSKELLADPSRSVADIAANLTYDPSNYTKFFKRFVGITPRQYREEVWAERHTNVA
jgi:AraC family transcriptional regulator of adaptative response / methylphosphotriester-DNA alkyltransferase methyltransferase